jgi:hypothetical protein
MIHCIFLETIYRTNGELTAGWCVATKPTRPLSNDNNRLDSFLVKALAK